MAQQLRPLWQALVYNTINYDRSTCSQMNIIYTVVRVYHIRIGERMGSPSQYIIPRPQ
jgi:hypothetical protein